MRIPFLLYLFPLTLAACATDRIDAPEPNDEAAIGARTVCVPVINAHIRENHIGQSDSQIKTRAATIGSSSGSWETEADAELALAAVASQLCGLIGAWHEEGPDGRKAFTLRRSGVYGRWCNAATCRDSQTVVVVFKKWSLPLLGTVSETITAYPSFPE